MTIKVETLAASTHKGKKMFSARVIVPRIVWCEVLTHRALGRNAASSRAIPISKMNDYILEDIARPVRFGSNKAGMQDNGHHDSLVDVPLDYATIAYLTKAVFGDGTFERAQEIMEAFTNSNHHLTLTNQEAWDLAIRRSIDVSNAFDKAGYHKQVANRLTEAGQHMVAVISGTDWDNFFHLRRDSAADPTLNALADEIWDRYSTEDYVELDDGEWHTPMFGSGYWLKGCGIDLDEAIQVSSSCCAQASYRKADDSVEKAHQMFERLTGDTKLHASPFEHQATPIFNVVGKNDPFNPKTWDKGITHVTREGQLCSGNLSGWIQQRQLMPNNVCNFYMPEGK